MFEIKSTLKIKIKIICLGVLLVLNNLSFGPLIKPAQAQELESQTVESILPLATEPDEQVLALPIPEETKAILLESEPVLEPVIDPAEVLDFAPKEDVMEADALTEEDPEPNFDRGENKISLEKLNLKTEGNSGALVYDFPIQVPQGRNGLQPNLGLSYNNQDNDKFNQFGAGWSLNIPSIKRINKKGSDNLYTEPYFSSSLSGELKLASSTDNLHGEYQAEVESGDFIKYELTENNYWQATDKTGTVYIFGLTTSSRQDNPNDATQIYQWLLTETRDTNDNYIKYEYFKDAGQIYIDTITYTGNGETDGVFKVEFLRETRADNLDSNNTGFNVVNNYRISEIDISINDNWVKKYELDYITGNNGQASYLDTILESAKDENNNIVSLPINDFDYQETVKSFTLEENYEFPLIFHYDYGTTEKDQGVRLADVNGDGYIDAVHAYYREYYQEEQHYILDYKDVYINDGNGHWDLDETYNFPEYFLFYDGDQGVRLDDVNGDGLVDVLRAYYREYDQEGQHYILDYKDVYINNGHGWDLDENYELPTYFISDYKDRGVRLMDVNGDGLVDFAKSYYVWNGNTGYVYKEIYINDGAGNWNLDTNYDIPVYFNYMSWGTDSNQGIELIDVNGDNLIDILRSSYIVNSSENICKEVYINNGNGSWILDETYDIPVYFYYRSWSTDVDQGVRLGDVNKDGLIDIIKSRYQTGREVYINNGHGWTLDENYNVPIDFYLNGNRGVQLGDAEGDDIGDLIQGLRWWNSQGEHVEQKVYLNNAQIESLSTIKNSQGAEININYQPSTQYKDSNGNLLNPNLPFVVQTVKQITINDGLGSQSTIDYQYSDGQYYYDNPDQRKVAGFGKVEKTIADTKTITYYHQGNESNSSQGEYQDSYAKIGRPYRSETYDNNTNTLLSQELYKWEETDLGHDNIFVYNILKSSTDFTNTTKSNAIEYQYSTTNGNLLTENNLGEVVINTGTGEITNQLTGDEKDTNYDYAENLDDHILAAPMTKVISDSSDSKEQNLYYDNSLVLGQVEKVNLTKEDYIEQDVEVNRNFNDLGLVTEEISPKNATTTVAYDSYNLYPASSTDPLNNVTYTEYNLLNGQVATTTAANGLITVNKYDAFGRLKEVWISNPDSPSTLIKKQEISYQDTTLPRYKETKDYFDTNSYTTSREYYDGLDRVIQKKNNLASQTEFATVDISYDLQGRVDRQSLPYITSSISYSTPNLSQPAKTYTYDALGRVLTETTPVGTTTYEYDGFTTKITDANNNLKELTKDVYGNLVEVKEYDNNGSNIYTTTYEYTLTNKLEKITDSAGNIRNFSYDALDNLEWQDMVHTASTQNPKKIQYTYDKNGNVVTETSFKNDAISYTYDDLNRPLLEKLSGNTKISYTYDQNGDTGQLSFVDYGSGNSKAYDYDILGRLKIATTTIGNEEFVINYDYNLNGELKEIVYPDNKVVIYNFNNVGQVNEITLNQGQSTTTLATNISYNQNGQMTHIERANSVTTDYTYDPNQAFRLSRILSVNASSTLQDLNYTYDAVGNILTLIDNANTDLKKSATYTYDDLNRLLSASLTYPNHPDKNYTQTFSYDSIGNMTSNSDLGTLNYANSNPHQLSSYSTRTFLYDNAGNMTRNGGINKFSWDYRNRLSNSYEAASENNTYYQYDHNNQRFIKWTEDYVFIPPVPQEELMMQGSMMQVEVDGGEEMDGATSGHWEWQKVAQDKYIENYFEKDIANNTNAHVFLNNLRLATIKNNNNPTYFLSDHLSSQNIVTDNSGNISELSDYMPYGKINYEIGSSENEYKFTDKLLDSETNLQYFGARYMDNELGKFISVDPAILILHNSQRLKVVTKGELEQLLSNPQNLNSYTYAVNNPVIMEDDNGEFAGTFGRNLSSGQRNIGSFFHNAGNYVSSQGGVINRVSGFVANSVGDVFDNMANVYDPDQGKGVRVTALALTALDASTGGEGKAIAKGLKLGQDFGKLGKVTENIAGKINSFDDHALIRMGERNVSQSLMDTVVSNPLVTMKQAGDRTLYLTREAAVVLDKTGKAITTYTKNEFKPHVLRVLNLIKK